MAEKSRFSDAQNRAAVQLSNRAPHTEPFRGSLPLLPTPAIPGISLLLILPHREPEILPYRRVLPSADCYAPSALPHCCLDSRITQESTVSSQFVQIKPLSFTLPSSILTLGHSAPATLALWPPLSLTNHVLAPGPLHVLSHPFEMSFSSPSALMHPRMLRHRAVRTQMMEPEGLQLMPALPLRSCCPWAPSAKWAQ